RQLIADFKWFVEERGGSANFWAGERPYSEKQAQVLFHSSVMNACRAADVDISPESNAGRGPVDFKFAAGWSRRAVVELKFAKSSASGTTSIGRHRPT
ncbi:MAG: hypothetical protein WEB55_05475, partial [Acidimicrobiia bacterium]